jgi:hypothetical protein
MKETTEEEESNVIEMKEFTMTSIFYSSSRYLSHAKLVLLDQKPEGKIFPERNKI